MRLYVGYDAHCHSCYTVRQSNVFKVLVLPGKEKSINPLTLLLMNLGSMLAASVYILLPVTIKLINYN